MNRPHNERRFIRSVLRPGHVCQNWRMIARSTPELWTILPLTITHSNCMASVDFVRQWLERSGGLLLSITLMVDQSPDEAAFHFTKTVIASTIFHAQRWQTVELAVPPLIMPWMSNALSNKTLDNLEDFDFNTMDLDHSPEVLRLNASPRRLTTRIAWLDQLSFDWQCLAHFVASGMGIEEIEQLFANAPSLESLDVGNFSGDSEDISIGLVRNVPKLRTLKGSFLAALFWHRFSFPSLETLRVSDLDEVYPSLTACLCRSGCQLKEVWVKEQESRQDKVVQLLKLAPNIAQLDLSGEICQEPLFSMLVATVTQVETMQPVDCFLAKRGSMSCTTKDLTFGWSWLVVFLATMKAMSES